MPASRCMVAARMGIVRRFAASAAWSFTTPGTLESSFVSIKINMVRVGKIMMSCLRSVLLMLRVRGNSKRLHHASLVLRCIYIVTVVFRTRSLRLHVLTRTRHSISVERVCSHRPCPRASVCGRCYLISNPPTARFTKKVDRPAGLLSRAREPLT